ncbi:E3 ubiquitin-protein ligase TRIM39-like isoform X2 [Denticeps clupeoides]|uniref:E3 ubiquitin-protein ligase TRIM39-like isoform X2 n=1 Tax=Denticeps clupeoides TaxID=299321 RepID=UPI0010A4FE7E|nr:E3 ubiquitin-protein ligase TRIM39-like isoform X2 [Denticeps clupeoides]
MTLTVDSKLIEHDLERYSLSIYGPTVHIRAQTKHEVKGIVCKPPRQDCLEAQIWGRIQKSFCCFEGLPRPGPIQFSSVTSDSVCLCWGTPKGLLGPQRFRVNWKQKENLESLIVPRTTITIQGLSPGEDYEFSVATVGASGSQSAYVVASTQTVIPQPQDLTVAADLTTASVTWSKALDQVSYLLSLCGDGEEEKFIYTKDFRCSLTGLQPGTEYTISVSTVVSSGYKSEAVTKSFYTGMASFRPEVCLNTSLSELTNQLRVLSSEKGSSATELSPTVSCDICRDPAVKSCLTCVASYCETHIKPHKSATKMKRHKLIDPMENLEEYICSNHDRPLKFFCRDDQTCVCQFCTEADHRGHETVLIEEECREKKYHIIKTQTEVHQMIQGKLRNIQEIKDHVEIMKKSTEEEISASVQVFTAVLRSIERSQAELLEVMEEEQRAAERQAEGLVEDLQQEITELQRRDSELEKISHTEDHLQLLQIYPTLCSPPHTKNLADVIFDPELWTVKVCEERMKTLRRAVSELSQLFNKEMEKLVETQLKVMKQHAVDVTLDPDSAHPNLILSADGKQVRLVDKRQKLPDNPERFDECICVLGKEGFSSGRFYYEVDVSGKTEWDLGIARESINRKGKITASPQNGQLSVILRNGNEYRACAGPSVLLSLSKKPQKVGVFVDYEEGLVSFYDVENSSHIYSFTGQTFSEKLFPLFSPCLIEEGKNSAPLIISPVTHSLNFLIKPFDIQPAPFTPSQTNALTLQHIVSRLSPVHWAARWRRRHSEPADPEEIDKQDNKHHKMADRSSTQQTDHRRNLIRRLLPMCCKRSLD